MKSFVKYLGLATIAVAASTAPASAQQSVADFYKGKTMEFIVGTSAGGNYDLFARLYARHLPRYLPGSPTIIVRNMPGGGHVIATNHLYNVSPRDGSVLAMVSRNMATQELLGLESIKFKMADFIWLGSPEKTNRICVAMPAAKVKKAADLFTTEITNGGAGAGTAISTTPVLLTKVLGMKFKVVEGYNGGTDVVLNMERGEVEGICQTLAGVEGTRPGWIKDGKFNVLFNLERTPIKGVPGVNAPSIFEFTKTEEQRQILAFYNSNAELGRPVMTTPGVPADRVAALRKAMNEVMKDPAFIEEAKKQALDVDTMTGEEVEAVAKTIAGTPKSVVDKTVEMVGKLGE